MDLRLRFWDNYSWQIGDCGLEYLVEKRPPIIQPNMQSLSVFLLSVGSLAYFFSHNKMWFKSQQSHSNHSHIVSYTLPKKLFIQKISSELDITTKNQVICMSVGSPVLGVCKCFWLMYFVVDFCRTIFDSHGFSLKNYYEQLNLCEFFPGSSYALLLLVRVWYVFVQMLHFNAIVMMVMVMVMVVWCDPYKFCPKKSSTNFYAYQLTRW